MEMEELPALDIPRDKETVLAPNGAHLMLVGLKRPLKFGEHFPMVLTFEKSGTVEIDIEVQKVGDLEPAD